MNKVELFTCEDFDVQIVMINDEPILIQGYLKGSINVKENDKEYENVNIFAGFVRQAE